MTIGQKLFYSNISILIVLILSAILIEQAMFQQKKAVILSQYSLVQLEEAGDLSVLIGDAKTASLQVQQFLSDVSATRALDGLSDGFDKAAESEKLFYQKIDQATIIAERHKMGEILKSLQHLKTDFHSYYELGSQMARAYVNEGTQAGNHLMAQFDTVAQKNDENLKDLVVLVHQHMEETRNSMHASSLMVLKLGSKAQVMGGVALCFVGVFLLAVAYYTQKNVVKPLYNTRDYMHKLARNFEENVFSIVDVVTKSAHGMNGSSQSLSAIAEETSVQASNVASAAEQASANVQTVAAASEELSASVVEILRQVESASAMALNAVREADNTNVRVKTLIDASGRIGEVVQIITSIAHQTNLLALNATIEAARAGDAGKGFAVVANEVKSLAVQTARATEEITTHIYAIQTATQDASQALEVVTGTISEINSVQLVISEAVHAQGQATQEIARNVQEAAVGTSTVTSNIVEVTVASHQTGEAAASVMTDAHSLLEVADTLKSEVTLFLKSVRAA